MVIKYKVVRRSVLSEALLLHIYDQLQLSISWYVVDSHGEIHVQYQCQQGKLVFFTETLAEGTNPTLNVW